MSISFKRLRRDWPHMLLLTATEHAALAALCRGYFGVAL